MSVFFSFIIPAFNSKKTIKRSLKSVINKNYTKNEIIIIDDKSSDGSLNKVNLSREIKNLKITIIKNKKNKGPGISRNEGIKKAKGKYLIFLDSDDQIISKSLKKFESEIIKNKYPDLILGLYKKDSYPYSNKIFFKGVNKKSYQTNKIFLTNIKRRKLILDECWPLIVKRKFLLKKKLFFPILRINEDQVFTNKLILNVKKILLLNEYFYYHSNSKKGLSKDFGIRRCKNYIASFFLMIKIIREQNIKIYQKNYLITVFEEIISNFISSLILIEDYQIKNLVNSEYKLNKNLVNAPIIRNFIKNKDFLELIKNFEKKKIQFFIKNYLIKRKIYLTEKKLDKFQIYIYCNTSLAHNCKKILNYFKFDFKKIIEDKDLEKNKKYFKRVASKDTCVLICNSKVEIQKRIKTKLKKFGFKNIFIYED